MQWDDVRVLLALQQARHLGDAASRLEMDRSTISRRLTALEKALGVQLFVRTRDGVRPTAAALQLLPHAERLESSAAALLHAARATLRPTAGLVRVATTEGIASFLLARGLLRAGSEQGLVVVELLTGNRPIELERGEAELAVRTTPIRSASLRVRAVGRSPIALFGSPEYFRARGAPRSPAGLSGHDVLLPSGELKRLPESRWLMSRPGVRVVFRSNSLPALMAAATQGIGLVPLPAGWGTGQAGLEAAFVVEALPRRPVWLVTPIANPPGTAVRVVSDRIAEIFKSCEA